MIDVSVIVIAWNVRELLYNCLKSVYKETRGINYEVIYVDNASDDGSVKMVKERFPAVRIIENEENKGFITANNQGIEISKGKYVLLLNSDTIILDNAIAKAVKFVDQHPEAAVIGCRVLNPDMTLQRTCSMYHSLLNMFLAATYLYKIFPRNMFFGRHDMTWWDFDDVKEVEVVYGCFSLVRREAINQIGLMDPRYFVFGDDPDWCYRFSKAGWKIFFTPEPRIIHYGGQTTKKMADKFILQLYGSHLIFMKLHRSKLSFPIARVLIALFFILRVPYWFAIGILKRNGKKESIQIAQTYLRGCFYCLTNWQKLLMNKEVVEGKL